MLMAKADTPALQYRRRKRRLAIHAALFAIVNVFFVGQWLLARDAPLEEVDPRVFASFWPVWLMLLWGVVLGIHGLYVWARKPIVEIEAARPVSWRFGRAVRTVVFTDIVGSTERRGSWATAVGETSLDDTIVSPRNSPGGSAVGL